MGESNKQAAKDQKERDQYEKELAGQRQRERDRQRSNVKSNDRRKGR
jgi:hypothetical protein